MIFDVILIRIIRTVYKPFLFVNYYFNNKNFSWRKIMTESFSWTIFPDVKQYSPFILLWSNLKGVRNPSIKNWACGKLSSSFDSGIMKTSIDPLICSQRKSNLVLNELMFKCPRTNLLILLIRISLRVRLAFERIVLEAFSVS